MMKMVDKPILQEPTAGVLTMQSMVLEKVIIAGYEQIRRLMRLANITPIYQRKYLTQWKASKYIYHYLLRHIAIMEVNQAIQN
jgi:putative transposase